MNTITPKATRSAGPRLGLALLGVLLLSGFSAFGVLAAGGKADFSIGPSPSSQTVSKGQSATYTVTVTRANGFAGPVSLSATGLPSGATAAWKLADGTASNVVPASLNGATLTISTGSSTPNGTTQPLITATSDKLSHTTGVTLVVQPPSDPNFTLSASAATQTVMQGDQTAYAVDVDRTGGFGGDVAVSVTGLPKAATASWNPGSNATGATSRLTLQVQAAGNSQAGSYDLVISGTATLGGRAVTRSATVSLVVQKTLSFQIAGGLAAQLTPGRKVPLNLSLTNPYNFDIQVTSLAVAVQEATSRPGCSGTQNYRVTQVPGARYPITVPAGQSRTLTQLGVGDGDKPQVALVNQPWNQDSCKNAQISLDFSGSAGK